MTIEGTFADLWTSLHLLRRSAQELDDVAMPPATDLVPLPVTGLREDTTHLAALVQEAFDRAARASKAVDYPMDLEAGRVELGQCQAKVDEASHLFRTQLASAQRMRELRGLGRKAGHAAGQWRQWVRAVQISLDFLEPKLFETGGFLVRCWQELASRASAGSVSVQATNIGQQITTADIDQMSGEKIP